MLCEWGGFMWVNATLLAEAQTATRVSSSPMTASTITATTTAFASNTATGSTSTSSPPELSCTIQNIVLGAGLRVPLGLAVIAATTLGFLLYRAKRPRQHYSGS